MSRRHIVIYIVGHSHVVLHVTFPIVIAKSHTHNDASILHLPMVTIRSQLYYIYKLLSPHSKCDRYNQLLSTEKVKRDALQVA